MIQVRRFNKAPSDRGPLVGFADVLIPEWRITIKNIAVFQKGAARWVNMPQRTYTGRDGSTQYEPLMEWSEKSVGNRFRKALLSKLEAEGHLDPKKIIYRPDYRPPDHPNVTDDEIPY